MLFDDLVAMKESYARIDKESLELAKVIGIKPITLSAIGYPKISVESIKKFIKLQCERVVAELKATLNEACYRGDSDFKIEYDFYLVKDGWEYKSWQLNCKFIETPIEIYPTLPPLPALKKINEAKEASLFDYFTIAHYEQNLKQIPVPGGDPLAIGRIKGDPHRYLIAQWGDDIKADDLI